MVIQIGRIEEPVSFPKDKSEWHSFLQGNVDKALKIREHVNNPPETSATWRLNDVEGLDPQGVHQGIVKLTGAWKAPKHMTNNRDRHWVNPEYIHAHHYSDAVAICECGIPVLRQSFGPNEKQPAHHQEHKDGCAKFHRLETQAQVLRNRREIIKDLYQHGHSVARNINRFGYSQRQRIGAGEVDGLGVDLGELAREGRKQVIRTAMVLCREHSPKKIAKIYDLHRKSISQMVSKESKSDASTLNRVRQNVA